MVDCFIELEVNSVISIAGTALLSEREYRVPSYIPLYLISVNPLFKGKDHEEVRDV